MPSDDPIILNPPKRPKLALTPTGIVAHWREVWKEWTTWLIGVLAFLPDILSAMVAQGWFSPADSSLAFKIVAGLAIAAKFVNQKKAEA